MHSVPLPDPLYIEALRAAEATGVSIERFVAEAVQLHLTDELETGGIHLTADQVAIIRKGEAEIKAGACYRLRRWQENRWIPRVAQPRPEAGPPPMG